MNATRCLWILYVLVGSVFLTSCRNEAKNAVEYNDRIIDIQSLPALCVSMLDSAVYGDDPALMRNRLEKLQIDLVNARTKLEQIGSFGEDGHFISATNQLLVAYNEMANDYSRVVDILEMEPAERDSTDLMEVQMLKKRIFDTNSRAHSAFLQAQLDFAVKYKFVLDRKTTN